ncbi:GNAT family N-acetyltransferase [Jannaschia sp. LMIT008]|uniref:GNAT family N-acetyltransferase n=1 Tax=Jannaschia maritima TaxID=3032585 RepID=UPI0028121B9C|nr:GNAT family N-acetyltransferase [Jannaschia sp. LMIT008]
MIRDARPADRDAIVALQVASWRQAYAAFLSPDYLAHGLPDDLAAMWAPRLAGDEIALVHEDGDAITGMICCLTDRDPAYVDNLHVDASRRGGGIGAALLRACFDRLRDRGRTACALTVWAGNHRGLRFYERMGGVAGPERDAMLVGHPIRDIPIRFAL